MALLFLPVKLSESVKTEKGVPGLIRHCAVEDDILMRTDEDERCDCGTLVYQPRLYKVRRCVHLPTSSPFDAFLRIVKKRCLHLPLNQRAWLLLNLAAPTDCGTCGAKTVVQD